MKVYKLTDKDSRSYGGMQWGENVTHSISKRGTTLCSNEVIHCYRDPLIAVLGNTVGGNYDEATMLMWGAMTPRIVVQDALKAGCKRLTTTRQIALPIVTTEQRVSWAICCALAVYQEPLFVTWANGWLSGADRSQRTAEAAARAVAMAAMTRVRAVSMAARTATASSRAAVRAAMARAREVAREAAAVRAAAAVWAARAAVKAAMAAEAAAAAVWAARAAEAGQFDAVQIAHELIEYVEVPV